MSAITGKRICAEEWIKQGRPKKGELYVKLRKWYKRKLRDPRARKKGIDLTFRQYVILLLIKKCYYTGAKITENNRSFDRVDPKKGYTFSNLVVCTRHVNRAKGWLEVECDVTRVIDSLKTLKTGEMV